MQAEPGFPTAVSPPVPGPPSRRRTVTWLVAVAVAGAAAAGSAVFLDRFRGTAEPAAQGSGQVATARLERRDLSATTVIPGSIGYGPTRPLTGHTDGTVTWLPTAGSTIKRGRQLLRADNKPVVLFYGSMPLYRPIAGTNLVGPDVRIVANNLTALGYPIGHQPAVGVLVTSPKATETQKPETVRVKRGDGVLTTALTEAIKRWQRDLDRPVTGQIAVGDIEVSSGAIRVDSVTVQPGSPANAELMSVTSTGKVITVAVELADAGAIDRGDRVTVTLPDDRTVKARVTAVGRDLTSAGDSDPAKPDSAKLSVSVTPDDPRAVADLDSGKVTVNFPGRTVKDALAAPIEALVSLTEGGYAVQGPNGLVAVKTGMFADGWVEVTGTGLTEGMSVVVAS
jgi:hypothetical protein